MDLPARHRTLAIDPAFSPGLDRLQRGWVVGCSGPASMSVAMAMVAAPMAAGSWAVLVGTPMFGVEAAAGYGVPLARIVRVDAGGAGDWAERVAAAAAGFELIVTTPPSSADRHLRRVQQRLRATGSVLLAVTSGPPSIPCDAVVDTVSTTWHGLGVGHGHLASRSVVLRIGGRRIPQPIEIDIWLPARSGGIGADADGRRLSRQEDRTDADRFRASGEPARQLPTVRAV